MKATGKATAGATIMTIAGTATGAIAISATTGIMTVTGTVIETATRS